MAVVLCLVVNQVSLYRTCAYYSAMHDFTPVMVVSPAANSDIQLIIQTYT